MVVPGISRPVLVGLIVIAVALFAVGAAKGLEWATMHTDVSTRVLAASPTIVVDARRGDVRVVASDRPDVRLQTRVKRSLWGGGHVRVSGDGTRLRLDDRCDVPPVVDDACGTSFVLEVPRATSVRVSDGTGDLHVENLGGSADLRTATGDVHLLGVRGPLRVQAETGDVDVEGPGQDVAVRTATGDIGIVATSVGAIRADSATGEIAVVVPEGTYAVDAQSDGGDDHVGLRLDADAPRRIHAHSGSGDVHVEPAG